MIWNNKDFLENFFVVKISTIDDIMQLGWDIKTPQTFLYLYLS